MHTEEHNLKVFGLGLSLLIPFIIMMHYYKHMINIWTFLLLFCAVMFVIAKSETIKPLFYVTLLGVYWGILKGASSEGIGWIATSFFGISTLLLTLTFINVDLIKPVYNQWMKVVRSIRSVELLCIIFYYTAFLFGGIVLRLIGKDLLNRKIEPDKDSYWIKREKKEFNKRQYTKQF